MEILDRFLGQTLIEGVELIHHPLQGKTGSNQFAATLAEALDEVGVFGQFAEPADQGRVVTRRHQESRFPWKTNFSGPVAIVGDNWFGGRQRLSEGTRQSFAA